MAISSKATRAETRTDTFPSLGTELITVLTRTCNESIATPLRNVLVKSQEVKRTFLQVCEAIQKKSEPKSSNIKCHLIQSHFQSQNVQCF